MEALDPNRLTISALLGGHCEFSSVTFFYYTHILLLLSPCVAESLTDIAHMLSYPFAPPLPHSRGYLLSPRLLSGGRAWRS